MTYYYMARKRILDRKLLVHIENSIAIRNEVVLMMLSNNFLKVITPSILHYRAKK